MGIFFAGFGIGLVLTLASEHLLYPWLKKLISKQ